MQQKELNQLNYNYWTKEQLESLPQREWSEDIGEFDSLIILPTNDLHDSGYMCIDFIAVKDEIPFKRLSGCSDVLHIDGIGGYGQWSAETGLPSLVVPKGWSIDCLQGSGLLRIFNNYKLKCGPSLSSFELYSTKNKN